MRRETVSEKVNIQRNWERSQSFAAETRAEQVKVETDGCERPTPVICTISQKTNDENTRSESIERSEDHANGFAPATGEEAEFRNSVVANIRRLLGKIPNHSNIIDIPLKIAIWSKFPSDCWDNVLEE